MRFVWFIRKLNKLYSVQPFGFVCYEAVRAHAGTDAAHAYGGYLSHLQVWCEERDVPHEGVLPSVVKKFWAGRGNAKKPEMIKEAQRRGFDPKDDNTADAIALWHWQAEKQP